MNRMDRMNRTITIKDIEPIIPFSRGTTEIFLTGHWSSRKPQYVEKTSPCRAGCPIGNDIARAFHQASLGNYDEALRIYRQENPLPGVCGRVCYHPCESECNRKEFDKAVNIRGFERFIADHGKVDLERDEPSVPSMARRNKKVAVVGSGPAGLSAAYHLARLGYPVTIFEALPKAGGMLRYGIPEYRLPRKVLDAEIGWIKRSGVKIKTNVRVGKDISLADMRQSHDAVFIAVGAHRGSSLGVEGEGMSGVVQGVDFLRSVNMGERVTLGNHVAVIGGGNTAIDCARTVKRAGAADVTIIYRRSRLEMPALPEDVDAVGDEGIKLELLAAPKRIIAEGGRLTGIECLRMQLGTPDDSGRARPVPIPGSEFSIPVDMVIAAVGQAPDLDFVKDLGLTISKQGVIEISALTAATNLEGVFAGGDGAGIKAYVADAIASGKAAALGIFCYLEGKQVTQEFKKHQVGERNSFSFQHFIDSEAYQVDLKNVVPYEKINTLCFSHLDRNENPEQLKPKARTRGFKEVVGGIEPSRMPLEIGRCFKCGTCTHCDLCFLLCPDISIVKSGENGYSVKTDYCKGCSICASSCPRHVIETHGGGK
jgi:NADPH-dependent glutamate synthase beta subunit-like oxidoreductase